MRIIPRSAVEDVRRRVLCSPAARKFSDVSRAAGKALYTLPAPQPVRRVAARFRTRPGLHPVSLDRLLLGDEGGMPATEYAAAVDDLTRPSRSISEWPHVRLLLDYREHGDELLRSDRLAETEYVRNARACLAVTGSYFSALDEQELFDIARGFIRWAEGSSAPLRGRRGSATGAPIRVRPIRHSDCFQVVDGHHRLAIHYVNGRVSTEVAIDRKPVWTPIQELLREMSWLEGRFELYQPLDLPELAGEWTLVRRCQDRFEKMTKFLTARGLRPSMGATYLDVASCYGWFLARMAAEGYDVRGIERDAKGPVVGRHVFGLEPSRTSVGDCVPLLEADPGTYDVVSCFSLLHHFVIGRGSVSAETLVRLLDEHTGRVLFVDTGQEHEEWFASKLTGWNADYIEKWLAMNTSFREIVRLGPDEDGVGRYRGNYGRMLYACVR